VNVASSQEEDLLLKRLFPAAVTEIPGVGMKVGQLGADCSHLAGEVLDTLLKCVAVGEWHSSHEYRLR
jgi:hypothetical protein